MTKTIKTGLLHRTLELDRARVDEESRTVELTFSSEEPVERFFGDSFGKEILEHESGSVRLNRLKAGGPLLMDHDTRDQVGVIESVSVDTSARKGRAKARFSQSARAAEIFQDVVDGIRRSVSVGYLVHRMMEDPDSNEFRAVDWEPLEISLVSVPADVTVGVGRSEHSEHQTIMETRTMSDESQPDVTPEPRVIVKTDEAAISAAADKAAREERERVSAIADMGAKHGLDELAREYIREGKSAGDFNLAVLATKPSAEIRADSAEIGLTDKERQDFSFVRLIRAQAAQKGLPDFSRKHIDAAGFELECHNTVAQERGDAQGLWVPYDVLRGTKAQRDLQVAVGDAGGNLVAEDFLGSSFIELLRNNMVTQQLGVRSLDGLVGDVAIPKHTAAATAYWVGEGGAPTESQQTIGQIAMTPKTLGAFTDYTRKLLLQSSIDIENFVRQDFAQIVALEMDRVTLYGLGAAGEPRGINGGWAGVNTTAFSTSATPTWAEIVDMEGDVAADNALFGSLAYATHPTVRANLKTTSKAGTEAIFVMDPDGTLNGYRCLVSTQITNTHVWFGNWADCLVGRWGGVDVLVDPYSASTTGTIRIVIFQSCDVALRHGESFSLGS